jgi:hypothetical protein
MRDEARQPSSETEASLAALRRFARPKPPMERCDLCSIPLIPEHRHLLEMENRRIVCACDGCALRFHDVVDGRYRLVPRDSRGLPDFRISDGLWESFAIPISLAFFFHSTPDNRLVALYPSPAGVTESLLTLESWASLVEDNPALERMESDVEALLVNRVGMSRDYFLAPIDTCYELAGLIRLHWRGLSGGDTVWTEINGFFDRLRLRSKPIPNASPEDHHA